MSEVAATTTRSHGKAVLETFATTPKTQVAVFTLAIFTSAMLLFSVQPLFAKMVLPKLGGTPAVWAISMCFFQTVLLAGYVYAHLLNRQLAPQRAVLAHLALLAIAFVALPIGLPSNLGEPPAGDAYFWALGVLTFGVGLPFFAVSANAPLLQSWFAKTGHAQAHDPYFLYAASNVGSLLALLSYPIVFEPLLGLKAQASAWMIGFVVLFAAICLAGTTLLLSRGNQSGAAPATQSIDVPSVVTMQQRAIWLALSFLPSGLLVAVTTYISTDVASAPFLWIIPLALFLATFILVFRDKLAFPYAPLHTALLLSCVLVVFGEMSSQYLWLSLASALAGFFIVSLIAHRELYLRRPSASHLTEFYIWMSLGGVLGGMFSALLAPKLFTSVLEFKLLLMAGVLLRPGVILGRTEPLSHANVAKVLGGALAVLVIYQMTLTLGVHYALGAVITASALVAGLYKVRPWQEYPLALSLLLAIVPSLIHTHPGLKKQIFVERSFFGTHRVQNDHQHEVRLLVHGTTIHGAQRMRNPDGTMLTSPVPATYYHVNGTLTRALSVARAQAVGRSVKSAVVGLGTGSMACHVRAGESMTFYEIDPTVEKIARDPKLFTFMSTCAPNAPVVLGDARLTLAKAAEKSFDYLLIDAFSSNAIPTHLLTKEALALYLEKLTDTGVLTLHISNRQLNLFPIIAATLADVPGVHAAGARWRPAKDDRDAAATFAVMISKSQATMAEIRKWPDSFALNAQGVRGWTDDYSDILPALLRK